MTDSNLHPVFQEILDSQIQVKMIATVKYQVATYSGEVQVNCNENDEDEYIIAKAKKIVAQRAGGSLPFGYESWKVVERS